MDIPPNGVAILGRGVDDAIREAVRSAGGMVAAADSAAGLVWTGGPLDQLRESVARASHLRWVQLPSAGVEDYVALMRQRADITWTSAKGIYGAAVAEHAVAMLLALRRGLPAHVRADSWSSDVASRPLVGSGDVVTVLGGGGIAVAVAELMAPFGVRLRVVRRRSGEKFAAPHDRLLGEQDLEEALAGADVLLITLPLTQQTQDMLGERELRLLAPGAILVNVGRGGVVDHAALLSLLEQSVLDGVGLDVTSPEPLPPEHGLWSHPRCLITSHTSNPDRWRREQLVRLVRDNVGRFTAGRDLRGRVDVDSGY